MRTDEDFYRASQDLIEDAYLKPFSEPECKTDLKNGRIERELHGAMHACRVSVYVDVLHQLFLENYPDYAKECVPAVGAAFSLTDQEVLRITRLVALGHDMGREDEADDRWEKKVRV